MDEQNLTSSRPRWIKLTIIIIIIIIAITLFFFYKKPTTVMAPITPTPTPSASASQMNTLKPSPAASNVYKKPSPAISPNTIIYDGKKFYPPTLTIKAGTNVHFINRGSVPIWVASNPHPAHTDLPGFDSMGPVKTGSYYGFTFMTIGVFSYHNHFLPDQQGIIVVTKQ